MEKTARFNIKLSSGVFVQSKPGYNKITIKPSKEKVMGTVFSMQIDENMALEVPIENIKSIEAINK